MEIIRHGSVQFSRVSSLSGEIFRDLPAQLGSAFKAYDIRGRLPDELNETAAYRIGLGFGKPFGRGKVALIFLIWSLRRDTSKVLRVVSSG